MEKIHYKRLAQLIYGVIIKEGTPLNSFKMAIKLLISKDHKINWEIPENHFEWECFYLYFFLFFQEIEVRFEYYGKENCKKMIITLGQQLYTLQNYRNIPVEKLAYVWNTLNRRYTQYRNATRPGVGVIIDSRLCLAFNENLIGRKLKAREGSAYLVNFVTYIASLRKIISNFASEIFKISKCYEIDFSDQIKPTQ